MIGTDSWDTTELNNPEASYALAGKGASYVIIPGSSAGEELFGDRSLTSELFSKLSPRNFSSNPWIEEVWNHAKMFNCSTPRICRNMSWDWGRLKMDSKVRNKM